MRRVVCLALAAASCGRLDFGTQRPPGDTPPPGDAAATPDASPVCNPLTSATVAECDTAYADPATAGDQLLYDCALSCHFGQCIVVDMADCPTCSCMAYVKSNLLCDPTSGTCSGPLNGTGCLGSGYYAMPPISCSSAGGLVTEGACLLRYLKANGDC